jgi:restriction system protein
MKGFFQMTEDKHPQTTRALGARLIHMALTILKENGGELAGKDVQKEIQRRASLDEFALHRYEKTGYIRWLALLHLFSIDCVKAGYLIKRNGIWFLTPEGDAALALGELGLLKAATALYREWKAKNQPVSSDETENPEPAIESREREIAVDEIEQLALEGFKKYISSKHPYEFQDLAAALLRGMGYFTPFVAPRGKDGGVDIFAYRDPLGTVAPRIKIQIKHRESPASVQEVRQLMGLLQKDGDVGIFISTGGFTPDAKATARGSHVHVELIDLERFISLWRDFYPKLTDEDKARLPLLPVYFVAPAL